MKAKANIFLVEDDQNFGSVLKAYLEMNGYFVHWIDDGKDALKEFAQKTFDICLLDVMLPNLDGFSIAEGIKKLNPDIPFIFLTAKTLKQDILRGYSTGADDYVTKPFDSEVLICKVEAILSRAGEKNTPGQLPEAYTLGKYTFNHDLREIRWGDQKQSLSPKESDLLRLLCQHMNQVLPRELALRTIWGEESYFTTRSMDVFITKLRKYLKDDPGVEIINIHGNGFRLMIRDQD
jgi:DNA-binding response OmpR family regulator